MGLHGIRWAASKKRALLHVIKNLQLVDVGLHRKSVAKLPAVERKACGLTLLSKADDFVGFKFKQMFGEDEFEGTVKLVISNANSPTSTYEIQKNLFPGCPAGLHKGTPSSLPRGI